MENLSRSLHPLEIPCVLQQILKCIPHADLKKTRLVSSTFNEEASRILRKRSKIVLNSPKRLIAFDFLSDGVNKFCECFQLINLHVASPAMMLFLKKLGQNVKSLELKDSKWSCEELESILTETVINLEELVIHGAIPKEARRLFSQSKNLNQVLNVPKTMTNYSQWRQSSTSNITSSSTTVSEAVLAVLKLPKIKQLDLQLYDKGTDEDALQQFIIDILSTSHNLEVLRSRDTGKWRNRRERFQRILFELLIDPEVNLILPKLRRINFSLTPSDGQIQKLLTKQFPLSYLNLSILPDISTRSIVSLLISLKHSLTKLKLSFTYWRLTDLPCDMNLYRLQHLSLDWFNGSLKFVSHLKNLQILILAQVDLNDIFTENEVNEFIKPHKMLSKFEVYQHSGAVVLPKTVNLISTVFPTVNKLVLGKLNDESLRVVFSHFPLLEELSAIEGEYSDFGLTGIEMETCKVCHQKHLSELCRGLYNEDLVNQQRKRGYIADLKSLRILELKSPYLTNLSVIHGIACCQRLKSLSLWCYELTFRALKKIVDTFELDYLETTHAFTHTAEIRYALARMQGRTFVLNGLVAPKTNSLISPEARVFLAQFRENMCRSILSNITRRDTDHSRHHHDHHPLFIVYEAFIAEQNALQDLIQL